MAGAASTRSAESQAVYEGADLTEPARWAGGQMANAPAKEEAFGC